jgi:hypothetical protein
VNEDTGSNSLESPLKTTVHLGFQQALNSVWDQTSKMLNDYRAANPAAAIFFTGHSLGAALATLAIDRFNGSRTALYTYGSPRVGNTAFCEEVRSRAELGIHRFVDNHDLVTTVPPKGRFYDHTSGLMHIDQNGDVAPNGVIDDPELVTVAKVLGIAVAAAKGLLGNHPPPPLVDHSPGRYCYFLWRWARGGQVP